MAQVEPHQHGQARQAAEGRPGGGAGGGILQPGRQERHRQAQGHGHPPELLDRLGESGGPHFLLALEETAHGGHDRHKKNGRGYSPERVDRPWLLDHDAGDEIGTRQEKHGDGEAAGSEDQQGYLENPEGLAVILEGDVLGHQLRNGYGNAGGRDGEQGGVNRVSHLVQTDPLVSHQGCQGNP